ncbi:glycosyltransferase 61 family protein [Nocardioides perillae]|uniref:Capsular polysaccharide biosynthesis protein n=1 Tax=Nocardioides perillae TaxID=1119534 RepID=A0A7Y9UVF1_9ACTN|nr:capsular polysaccharide biosynthesis protein [Nocardioides perillae]
MPFSLRAGAVPPAVPPGVLLVEDALVTRFVRGPLRMAGQTLRWMSGAVHDAEGRLVPLSQRDWDGDEHAPVAADPAAVVRPDGPGGPDRLAGTWHYAGHWTRHFGHFLVETVPNLWPEPEATGGEPVAGLVAHRSCYGPAPAAPGRGDRTRPADLWPWQEELLDLAGYGGMPVEIVRAQPRLVDRLRVASRPVLLKSRVGADAVTLWQRMAASVQPAGEPAVFLSRARFHAENADDELKVRVEARWEEQMERLAGAAGFTVVHPETLSVREQVALLRGARVVAGSAGSALHLAVFAEPGTTVVEVGDQRTPDSPLPSQRLLDEACGHTSLFVPYADEQALARVLEQAVGAPS